MVLNLSKIVSITKENRKVVMTALDFWGFFPPVAKVKTGIQNDKDFISFYWAQIKSEIKLVPKGEILDRSDFHDAESVGDFGVEIFIKYFNIWEARHHLISHANAEHMHKFLMCMFSLNIKARAYT